MLQFHICDCGHGVFNEVAASLRGSLLRLGHAVSQQPFLLLTTPETINIAFAVFSAPVSLVEGTQQLIVYNFEQFGAPTATPIRQTYFRIMRRAFVWEYSASHVPVLHRAGIEHATHVPLAAAPEWIYPTDAAVTIVEDIDILFYGAPSFRRVKIIDALKRRGVNVVQPTQLVDDRGEALQKLVVRAKLLLNIACFENVHTLEMVRLSPWLALGKAVVTEIRADTHWDTRLADAFCGVPYDALVDTCMQLLADPARRATLGVSARRVFAERNFDDSVRAGVDAYVAARDAQRPARVASGDVPLPTRLRYANAENWAHDYVNLSPNRDDDPDMVIDLVRSTLVEETFDSWRFGRVHFASNYFELIEITRDFASRDDVFSLLRSVAPLLRNDGQLLLTLPFRYADHDRSSATALHTDGTLFSGGPPIPPTQPAQFETLVLFGLAGQSTVFNMLAERLPEGLQTSTTALDAITHRAIVSVTFRFKKAPLTEDAVDSSF